jgi:hypothetical protein
VARAPLLIYPSDATSEWYWRSGPKATVNGNGFSNNIFGPRGIRLNGADVAEALTKQVVVAKSTPPSLKEWMAPQVKVCGVVFFPLPLVLLS